MRPPLELLYLSDADIRRCEIAPEAVTLAVESAFAALRDGQGVVAPPLQLVADARLDFKAKGGILPMERLAAVKWYGFAADNPALGLPNFVPLMIVNEMPSGRPLAVMDGHWISGVRTAAITTVAASALARPESGSVGFIGAGLQAHSHLDALRARFALRRLVVHTRNRESAQRLLDEAQRLGMDARWSASPEDAVKGLDIVVSSIPRMTERAAFLDGRWLDPDAFVAMVDAGTAWDSTSLGGLGPVYTDHLDAVTGRPLEPLNYAGHFTGDLSRIAGIRPSAVGLAPGPRAVVFGGSGLADVAVAAIVYRRALSLGIGTRLPM